jgi:class 3 adenylate cyclase
MFDIAVWLQELGLDRYTRAFEENEIDFEALPYLSERMLQQIGLPIGPRAKLLGAISQLSLAPASYPKAKHKEHAEIAAEVQRRHPERRQLTVIFCDLVDSTKLARSLDPEDLKSVMESYRSACGAVIERHGGYVAQYRGDSIEAYFGWPAAQEDAAERAVRAALESVEAVKAIKSAPALSVRVGISTGILVIGGTDYGNTSTPSGVFGDAPYVAARLQTIAEPNAVVIAETTSRLVSARFVQEALGSRSLKGIPEPIYAFRVWHVREDASRFHLKNASALTPLVGRRTELAWLQQQWCDAKGGAGRVAFVSGVPGIGKSRLVHELEQWINGEPHFSLRFQCLPHNMQSPLSPVIQQLRRLGGLATEDTDQTKLDKLHRLFSWATEQVDKAVPLLAEMISIPIKSRYPSLGLTPLQTKFQTLSVLANLLLSLSTRKPLLCLLEDGQWMDASTQELLDLLMGQIGKARILLAVTHRPEYHPRPCIYGNASALTIPRLPRHDVAELTQLALREHTISTVLMRRIIDESDSIPLFVEELARGVVESGRINEHGAYNQRVEPSASWSVPASLRDSLAARLDQAPEARSVAQIAAVLGREFSFNILLRVSSLDNADLDLALAHLEQSEIVQLIDDKRPNRYAFKHALMRDAAYESLLKSSRREIHAKVAAAIKDESPEVVADEPELLAFHYSLAGNAQAATRYWLIGGHRARSRSANLEAIAQFENALQSLELLPKEPVRDEMELEVQLSLGLCFVAVRGYAADDTRKSFERAHALSAHCGGPFKEIQAIYGLWGHYWMVARHDRAIELGETLLSKAQPLHEPITLAVGHRALGSTLFTLGHFIRAQEHLEQAIVWAPQASIERSLSYAVDPRIAALLMLGWDLWILGFPGQALDNVLQALKEATENADPYSAAFAHYVTSAVRLLRGEFQQSLEHAEVSLSISAEHRINLYELYSRFGRGCALARMGQQERAISEIREGIEGACRCNLAFMRGFMLGWLATVQAETGDPKTALLTIDEALKSINDVAGRAWEAELHRVHADSLLAARPGDADAVERIYTNAIAVSRRQCARSLELRATTSLARLLWNQGRNDEARALLAPVYGWFTEGLDTADLRDAKVLLDDLEVN